MFISSRAGLPAQNFGRAKQVQQQQKKLGFGVVKFEGALEGLKPEEAKTRLKDILTGNTVGDTSKIIGILVKNTDNALRAFARSTRRVLSIGLHQQEGRKAEELVVKHVGSKGNLIDYYSGPVS